MRTLVALAVIARLARPAAAEPPTIAVRVSAAFGTMKQLTWEAPEVDLVATFPLGARGFVAVAGGYAIIDNHTYFADGRTGRLAVAAGGTLGAVRIGGELGLELVGYHADPDLAAEQPDVDQLALQGGLLPTVGATASHRITDTTAIGVFVRVGLRELTLYETTAGDRERARLVLGGAYLELAIR